MKRILFIQGGMEPWFGGNVVMAWMLNAVKDDYDATMISWTPTDFDQVNRTFGTDLGPGDIRVVVMPRWLRSLLDRAPIPLAHLRIHLLFRAARNLRRRRGFDVVVSGQNEGVFGSGGIQYVHFPWGFFPRPEADLRWYHFGPALRLYRRICERLSWFSRADTLDNVTLVNSDWTGGKFTDVYGGPSVTLYPPVFGGLPELPWPQRKVAFVCLGRLAPEKEIPKMLRIVDAVRARSGQNVDLHIVGSDHDRRHAREIHSQAARHGPWVHLHTNVSQAEKTKIIANCRYGIHGMVGEHFGIAVAEMQRAGCIVFVPGDGGPAEIIGGDPRLLYSSPDDAVARICRVLADPNLERELAHTAHSRRDVFSEQRFVREFLKVVDDVARRASGF